jgi:hypothetical protein
VRLTTGVTTGLVAVVLVMQGCSSPASASTRPTGVTASGWNNFAIVHWQTPAKTGGSHVAAYRVLSQPGNVEAVFSGDQNWGVVSGLKNHVGYRFRVVAVNAANRSSRPSSPSSVVTAMPLEIHVRGNQFVNGAGRPVRLFGVNRSGTEYMCVVEGTVGAGVFSGPSDAASVALMASWHINAVRLPLNEDCWLGINGVNQAYSGSNYRGAIASYVDRLNAAGLVAILDLHWNAPGGRLSGQQQAMADGDHSPAFWTSVAATFKANPGVIFDLYNEPTTSSWDCWRSGCETRDGWRTAGMQSLIDVVRAAGATQPIVAAGLSNANDLSGWLSPPLSDPFHQLVAGPHVYDQGSPGYCATVACWNSTFAPVAAQAPVLTGELAELDRRSDFVTKYMRWADDQWTLGRSVSFVGWSWDAALGEGGPSLISSFDGTPTRFGRGFRAYLEKLFNAGEVQQG